MPAPLSVIVPTLNSGADLQLCLNSLMPGLETGLIREVLVVDGGSEDATLAIAERTGATIVRTETAGRSVQLRAGADRARGQWLLFLHSDTALSRDWADRVLAHIQAGIDQAAVFKLVFRSDAQMARTVANRANRRARTLGLPYGDQGLLISRPLYNEIGGYADTSFLEDVLIVRAIGKSRLTILRAEAHTSAAKYERDGWRKRSWRNAWIITRFLLGAAPDKLAKAYR